LLVYKIIEDHGGSMEVKSELGKGSKFTISLPQKGLGK
jgi:signal transduction histidine kinase